MEDIREIKEERGKEIGSRTLCLRSILFSNQSTLLKVSIIPYPTSVAFIERKNNRYSQTFKGLTLQADKGDDTCI